LAQTDRIYGVSGTANPSDLKIAAFGLDFG
jgi:hypothetical protein